MQIASLSPAGPAAPVSAPQPAAPASAADGSFEVALATALGKSEPSAVPAPLSRKLRLEFFGEAAADGVITGAEMRAARDEAAAEYQRRFRTATMAQGIAPSAPLSLKSDAMGRVVVVGDHPDKARIEQLFADDDMLSNAFRKANSLAHLMAASEAAMPFHAAYERDPKAAVAQYAHLFNTTLAMTVKHRWGPDGLDVSYDAERVLRPTWG